MGGWLAVVKSSFKQIKKFKIDKKFIENSIYVGSDIYCEARWPDYPLKVSCL